MPWLDERIETIYVVAEDGKRYAFTPRKTDPSVGQILVRGPDGKRYGVTGERRGDRFVTNPYSKNARAVLSQEEIDRARDLPALIDTPATELAPNGRSIHDMSEEEVKAYLDSKYGPPPS